jgi:hypothetical protein
MAGISIMLKQKVKIPRRRENRFLTCFEIKAENGINKEPKTGTKTIALSKKFVILPSLKFDL